MIFFVSFFLAQQKKNSLFSVFFHFKFALLFLTHTFFPFSFFLCSLPFPLQICYTRALALSLSKERDSKWGGRSLSAFAVCPGSVKTDMSSNRGTKSPEQGADTPLWLSLVPPTAEEGNVGGKSQGKSGLFFAEREVIDF